MHSLEAELRELSAGGALEKAAAAGAIALERRTVFSLFEELRAALYAAVALVITGVGILVMEHLDRIGPLTLILALALAAVACYVPAIRTRSRGTARSTAADYLLLLGALFVSADLGYVESQFHWLGANWSRHLLILTALHAYTAYVLDSRLVLSVALATLAGWFGIERGPGSITAWGAGWNALIVSEYIPFLNPPPHVSGLGYLLDIATFNKPLPDNEMILLTILTMIVIVLAMNKLLWRPLYKRASVKYRVEV